MISLIAWLGILVIVVLVVFFLLSQFEIPPKAKQILTVLAVVIVAIIAIAILSDFAQNGTLWIHR